VEATLQATPLHTNMHYPVLLEIAMGWMDLFLTSPGIIETWQGPQENRN
jgi:hypothetical protein